MYKRQDLTDDVISREVLNSLLEYDQEAVWMVQAWWSNPTNDLLKGMGDDREDHVIILDLNGLNDAYDSYWDKTEYNGTVLESDEFNSTSWVWCMLENYGGNPSMDGRPKEIINRINKASTQAEHMKGIGFISEATYDLSLIHICVANAADLTSTDLSYSKKEFREFILDSREMGVNIVPEFDAPGHSGAFMDVRPDLHLKKIVEGNAARAGEQFDLSDEHYACLLYTSRCV